jgi:restriction system protein
MHRHRLEQEYEEETRLEKRHELQRREHAEKEKRQRALLDHWNNLSNAQFEQQCAQLFKDLGFTSELTPPTNDGGIDILLAKAGKRGAAQCKNWSRPCGVEKVREFYGVVSAGKLAFGYFISKSGFTESAAKFLRQTHLIEGWSTSDLVERALKPSP